MLSPSQHTTMKGQMQNENTGDRWVWRNEFGIEKKNGNHTHLVYRRTKSEREKSSAKLLQESCLSVCTLSRCSSKWTNVHCWQFVNWYTDRTWKREKMCWRSNGRTSERTKLFCCCLHCNVRPCAQLLCSPWCEAFRFFSCFLKQSKRLTISCCIAGAGAQPSNNNIKKNQQNQGVMCAFFEVSSTWLHWLLCIFPYTTQRYLERMLKATSK